MTTGASFVANIQRKLPCATLFLQKKTGPLLDWRLCALTATSKDDPLKTFTMTFVDGLGEAPLDDVANTFVDNAIRVLNGNR